MSSSSVTCESSQPFIVGVCVSLSVCAPAARVTSSLTACDRRVLAEGLLFIHILEAESSFFSEARQKLHSMKLLKRVGTWAPVTELIGRTPPHYGGEECRRPSCSGARQPCVSGSVKDAPPLCSFLLIEFLRCPLDRSSERDC